MTHRSINNKEVKGVLMASDEDEDKLQEPKLQREDAIAFSSFTIPTARPYLNGLTGLCHCVARREGGNRNKRIILYLESSGHVGTAPKPLFVAQKQKEGKFFIFDVADNDYRIHRNFRKDSHNYVGKIRRKRFPKSKIISNTLFLGTKEEKKQISSVVYDTVSLRYPVMQGYPDRLVYSILQQGSTSSSKSTNDKTESNDSDDDHDDHENKKKEKEYHASTAVPSPRIDDIIQFHSTNIAEIADYYRCVQVLKSRRRHSSSKKNRQPFLVRFRGRGGRSSQKNIQIVKPSTDEIVFQMARWNEDEFTVDFKNPYTAYTAFGIALAQLEL